MDYVVESNHTQPRQFETGARECALGFRFKAVESPSIALFVCVFLRFKE